MTDPYVTFDTFSLGDNAAEPAPAPAAPRPSLLAKLPRVAPTSTPTRPKPIQRFDAAESPLHGVHLGESGADLAMAGSAIDVSPIERRPSPTNPAATLRIDTVSPTSFDDEEPAASRPSPAPIATAQPAAQPTAEVVVDDPWASWLLNLESAIVPYSRVIVLAAVIAAMGLTVVLLRGGTKTTSDVNVAPQVSTDGADDSLVSASVFGSSANSTASSWPTSVATQPAGDLRPIDAPSSATPSTSMATTTTPIASAAGPASAWRGPAGAKLTGQVLPANDNHVEVAEVPAYPPTTTR